MNEKKGGYIEPEIRQTAYVLGDGQAPEVALEPTGNWQDVLPVGEEQKRHGVEGSNCTAFAITNVIEMYEAKAFGESGNWSDRFLGLCAGTTPKGNDPEKVFDAVRHFGLIPEEMMPFSDDISSAEEYYSWKGVDKEACLAKGREWLATHTFNHDLVPENPESIKYGLTLSPFAVGVYAFATNDIGEYIRLGSDCHLTSMYAVNCIFDSYIPFQKVLASNFGFTYIKRIHLEKKSSIEKSYWFTDILKNILSALSDILKLDVKIINTMNIPTPTFSSNISLLAKEAREQRGQKLVSDWYMALGCVIAVNAVYSNCFNEKLSDLQGTALLADFLAKDPRFKEVTESEATAGTIKIYETGRSTYKNTPVAHGHAFILGKLGDLYSNDSNTGIWGNKWSVQSAFDYYEVKGGYRPKYFNLI